MNQKFEGIIRSVGEIPESTVLDETQRFEADLGVESLALMDIIVNIEAEFGIEIEAVHRFATLGELWQQVELLSAKAGI